jgi:hypothetical protein
MLPIYGTVIKVIAGFYLGCTGYVVQPTDEFYKDKYLVELTCEYKVKNTTIKDMFRTTVDLKDLKIISQPRQ